MSSRRLLICAASALWLAAAGCVEEPPTGDVRAHYLLQDGDGAGLSCEVAGVRWVQIELYASREDSAPVLDVSLDCLADTAGEGTASGTHDVGFFNSARVALLDGNGDVALLATGEPARWEYLTVELTGGGVMELLPPVVAVFDATDAS